MYKVLIVDDESIIVDGLQKVIDWSAYGCQVVATAHDAVTGAAAILEHQPHILFTDINMPGQDGLTMIAGLRSQFPHLQITVLTGFRDFEYAQRALHLGVTRFLLKPSKMAELEEAVSAMVEHLKQLPSVPEPVDLANQEPVDTESSSFVARQAQAYIAQHYAEKLSLQEVATHCYVSQWHLSKLLSKHLGQNFYDILNGVRVQKAKELLENPALRISEVAEEIGYADTAHFSRIFKKLEGISANEWRNQHCGK